MSKRACLAAGLIVAAAGVANSQSPVPLPAAAAVTADPMAHGAAESTRDQNTKVDGDLVRPGFSGLPGSHHPPSSHNPSNSRPLPGPAVPSSTSRPGGVPLSAAGQTGSAGDMIGFSHSDGSGTQIITLVDSRKSWMAVYHVDRAGTIRLISSRPIAADFTLQLNATSPLPDEIRQLGNRSR